MAPRRTAVGTAAGVALLAIGLGLPWVTPASADQTWIQSIGRASQEATCPESSAEDVAAGWSQWGPTWERWSNDNTGGWTCTRSNTWAKEGWPSTDAAHPGASYPSAGCIPVAAFDNEHVQFGGGWHAGVVTSGDPVLTTYDSGCETPHSGYPYLVVYAPEGWSAADLCLEAFDLPNATLFDSDVYRCRS